jgi:hypothetical protein
MRFFISVSEFTPFPNRRLYTIPLIDDKNDIHAVHPESDTITTNATASATATTTFRKTETGRSTANIKPGAADIANLAWLHRTSDCPWRIAGFS